MPALLVGNDNLIRAKGLLDTNDPKNANGSPKFINNATGTWTLINPSSYTSREDILLNGTTVSTGSTTPVGSGGDYLIELDNSVAIVSTLGYYLHVVLTSGSYVGDVLEAVAALTRTGRTPVS